VKAAIDKQVGQRQYALLGSDPLRILTHEVFHLAARLTVVARLHGYPHAIPFGEDANQPPMLVQHGRA